MSDGTTYELKIKPADIVKFERKFDVPISELTETQKYEWILYLAWLSAKRNGVTDDYDTWIEKVEEILKNDNYKTQQKIMRDKALEKKVDVNKFMEWFILNYPNSYEKIKENPTFQYKAK